MSKGYYHSKESVDEYISLAKGYDGSFLIKLMKNYLKEGASILELGSGPGKDVALLNQYYNVTGSDYSEEFLSRLAIQYPDNDFFHANAADIDTARKFDAVYSNKVLHHLTDEELDNSLMCQYKILNDRGVVCHSFWAGEGEEYYDTLYVNNHTIENLTGRFAQYFDILKIELYKEMEEQDSIIVIAQKRKAVR